MKHILILLSIFFFIGCQQETPTVVENRPSTVGWKLEYFQKVKIQNEELYECVYGRAIGWNSGAAFSILSNTTCREKL